jgi:hypothetical protein
VTDCPVWYEVLDEAMIVAENRVELRSTQNPDYLGIPLPVCVRFPGDTIGRFPNKCYLRTGYCHTCLCDQPLTELQREEYVVARD